MEKNSPTEFLGSMMEKADNYARKEPAVAALSAFGIGLLIPLLPRKFISHMVGLAVSAAARSALLSLGAVKAGELYAHSKDSDSE